MKDKSLTYIDDSLIETVKFLSGVSSDPLKLECLVVFAKCQSIMKWIRNETEGRVIDYHCKNHETEVISVPCIVSVPKVYFIRWLFLT